MKNPYSRFFWNDHLTDLKLQSCHPAAQGVWINLLCIMSQGQPYGHLRTDPPQPRPVTDRGRKPKSGGIANGPDNDPHQVVSPMSGPNGLLQTTNTLPPSGSLEHVIYNRIGVSKADLAWAIRELEEHGVLSRTEQGIIFSRRMVRDAERVEQRAQKARKAYERRQNARPHPGRRKVPMEAPSAPTAPAVAAVVSQVSGPNGLDTVLHQVVEHDVEISSRALGPPIPIPTTSEEPPRPPLASQRGDLGRRKHAGTEELEDLVRQRVEARKASR